MKTAKYRILLISMLCILCALCLCSCGKKGDKVKDYAGYYTSAINNYHSTLEISKSGTVVYRVNKKGQLFGTTYGTLEISGNKGYFYNMNYIGDSQIDWTTTSFPLIFTLINDGDGLYVDSDSDSWNPESFTRVDKKSYDSFSEEHYLINDD